MTTSDSAHLARPDPLLRADEVSFGYGSLTIVDGVSVEVGPGEIVALLGPNGAGKSTLVKGLIGHLPLLSGAVWLNGFDISTTPAPMRVRMGVGYVPQIRDVFAPLTVWENLSMGGYPLPRSAVRERAEAVLALFPALEKRAPPSRRYAERRRTEDAGDRSRTDDEPKPAHPRRADFEPRAERRPRVLEEIVGRLAEAGQSVLMVEQRVQMTLEVATFGYVLVQGKVRLARSARELQGSEAELAELFFNAGVAASTPASR